MEMERTIEQLQLYESQYDVFQLTLIAFIEIR